MKISSGITSLLLWREMIRLYSRKLNEHSDVSTFYEDIDYVLSFCNNDENLL